MFVAATEVVLFAPVVWFALKSCAHATAIASRRDVHIALIGGWLLAIWLLLSGDPVHERLVRFLCLNVKASNRFTLSRPFIMLSSHAVCGRPWGTAPQPCAAERDDAETDQRDHPG
jgi:hypothetical protein